MSLLSRAKEAAISRTVEACAAAITVLIAWFLSLIAPAIWPAILKAVPIQALLPVLLLSLLLNLILGLLLYLATKKPEPEFQLHYGVYWDKNRNPHCPVCKNPVVYDNWGYQGFGYHCQPCNKVTPLKDAAGVEIKPEQVFQK